MYPTKLDNLDIQTEVSSQFGFIAVKLTVQSDISTNVTNFCTKKQRLSVALVTKFPTSFLPLSFSK